MRKLSLPIGILTEAEIEAEIDALLPEPDVPAESPRQRWDGFTAEELAEMIDDDRR